MDQFKKIAHLLCFFFVIYMYCFISPGSMNFSQLSLFSWHPFLMSLAYGCMMFQAIKLLSKDNLLPVTKRAKRIKLHWWIQVCVIILATVGFAVVYYGKVINKKIHFVTWHSQFGLLALFLTIGNGIGGLLALYPKVPKAIGWKPHEMKVVHSSAGFVTYASICIALISGMKSTYFMIVQKNAGIWYEIILLIPAILAVEVFSQVYFSYWSPYRRRV